MVTKVIEVTSCSACPHMDSYNQPQCTHDDHQEPQSLEEFAWAVDVAAWCPLDDKEPLNVPFVRVEPQGSGGSQDIRVRPWQVGTPDVPNANPTIMCETI